MVNHAVQNKGRQNREPRTGTEAGNWTILKNKTRERLNKDPRKIPECSCWLRQKKFTRLTISGKKPSWELGVLDRTGEPIHGLYTHPHLLGVLGWIFQNRLYHRHRAVMTIEGDLKVFESTPTPVDPDRLYLAFQPLKPLSEKVFEQDPRWAGIVVLLVYDPDPGKEGLKQAGLSGAEVLVSNTWGELFLETMAFDPAGTLQDSIGKIADLMSGYGEKQLKIHICQLSDCRDPDIVYQIKKAYNDRLGPDKERPGSNNKPYLDRL
jgi:adenylate cyclase class 1